MDVAIRLVSAMIMIALPLVVGILLARRAQVSWRFFGIGAITFVGAQVFHLPFNAWILQPLVARLGLSGSTQGLDLAVLALLFGLSAGFFEETARLLTLKFWLRDARSTKTAFMFGAGHGGIEAVLLGSLALLALFQAMALRDSDLAAMFAPDQAVAVQAQLQAYWSAPWHLVILAPIERVLAIGLHLTLAYLVLQSLTRRNLLWAAAAVLWHAAVNTAAVYVGKQWSPYIAEALTAALVIVGLGIITMLSRMQTDPAPQVETVLEPPSIIHLEPPADISDKKLHNSRFLD